MSELFWKVCFCEHWLFVAFSDINLFVNCGRGRRPRRPVLKASSTSRPTNYVTFVRRYKSNQKNFWVLRTPLTADGNNSAKQTEQKMFCSAAATALKVCSDFECTCCRLRNFARINELALMHVSLLRSNCRHIITFCSLKY